MNCITDDTILSVLRYGSTPLAAAEGETLTSDCGKRLTDELKYSKIVTGAFASMTGGEITTVDDAEIALSNIDGARTLLASDSGGYTVVQTSAYTITLPPVERGLHFMFQLSTANSFEIVILATGDHMYGIVNNAGTYIDDAALPTIEFEATNAQVSDIITLTGISPTRWCVQGFSSNAAGIKFEAGL